VLRASAFTDPEGASMTATESLISQALGQRKSIRGFLQFDPIRDLGAHYDADGDSFYMLSYVKSGGQEFTVLFHQMLIYKPPLGPIAQLAISAFDEKTTEYHCGEMTYFLPQLADPGSIAVSSANTVSETVLDIAMPGGRLSGTIDAMSVKGHAGSVIGLNMRMEAHGPLLPNLVTGMIPFAGGVDWEYAIPGMDTSGTLTVDGKTYDVKGTSWFDRQWGRFGPYKWIWMAVQLENGVQMSLWDQQGDNTNPDSHVAGERAFVTLLYPDGSLAVAPVKVEERSFWTSPRSKQKYATSWSVSIPAGQAGVKQADLEVELLADDQEIGVLMPRMEGKARVNGNYEGKKIQGVTTVEMFNLFPIFELANDKPAPQPQGGQMSNVR
jgi:lipocalin-like protein/hydroxyneurosporene synthase CrtC